VNSRHILVSVALVLSLASGISGQPKRASSIAMVLGPRGLYPNEFSVESGPVNIHLLNRTGQPQVEFRIRNLADSKEAGSSKLDVNARKVQRANSTVNLQAGEYELSIVGRPGVACRINVKK
jgi:hypothetical protein